MLLRWGRGCFDKLRRDALLVARQKRVDLLLLFEKSCGGGNRVGGALSEEGFRRLLPGVAAL